MSFSFNFIDHTADIAVEIKADSVEELFTASSLAFKEAVMESGTKKGDEKFFLKLNSHSLETLLVNFLNELNFRLIYKNKIFHHIDEIKINQMDEWYFECILLEDDIDEDKIKTEIKSVTYHQMTIKKIDGQYSTRIIFDI
jgi:SHS2 domain-containing protein